MKVEIPIQITLLKPPANVLYAIQEGKARLASPARADGSDLSFNLKLTLAGQLESGAPRFTGEFAQGPPTERFVYVAIGTSAGDPTSPWTRRAKIHVSGITWKMVEAVQAKSGCVIAASFAGTDKKGEPSCASMWPADGGWMVSNPG